ncbi:hypothetical protein, partial [Deinococcus roseus]|uniref:hypothetical protein n=1 Tax=Deinococcus roseus TaxID=392414 RepID=UPI001662D774
MPPAQNQSPVSKPSGTTIKAQSLSVEDNDLPQTLPASPPGFSKQGIAPTCNQPSASGTYPYSTSGPSWRTWKFFNETGTPYNYYTFTAALPVSTSIFGESYTTSSSLPHTPYPFIYHEIRPDPLTLTGTLEGTTTQVNEIYVNPGVSYGLVYRPNTKDYELPINNTSVTSFKMVSNNQTSILSANQWYYPTINSQSLHFPGNQNLTLEFYFTGTVTYKQETVLTNYKDPGTGAIKQGWVTVNMPFQDAYLKVTADKYRLANSSTVVNTNGGSILTRITMRGFTAAPSADRKTIFRKEMWYYTPQGITSSTSQAFFDWLDNRKDYAMSIGASNLKLARASVDAAGSITSLTALTTEESWNLGLASKSNNSNCVSKSVYVKPDGQHVDVVGFGSPESPSRKTTVSLSAGATITGVDGVQVSTPAQWIPARRNQTSPVLTI